jgi:crossover junction endodeoxyribonuclease RusA
MAVLASSTIRGGPPAIPATPTIISGTAKASCTVDEPVCRLLLPIPPSTNNLFTNKRAGGRVKSAKYKAWMDAAGWEIKLQRPPTLHPPLRTCLRVLIEAPLGQNRDLDNALKPLLDVLVKMGVIADDSLVDDLRIVRNATPRAYPGGTRCVVSIWPM